MPHSNSIVAWKTWRACEQRHGAQLEGIAHGAGRAPVQPVWPHALHLTVPRTMRCRWKACTGYQAFVSNAMQPSLVYPLLASGSALKGPEAKRMISVQRC